MPGNEKILFRSFPVANWLERLTASAEVVTVLGSISSSPHTGGSEGWQMKQF